MPYLHRAHHRLTGHLLGLCLACLPAVRAQAAGLILYYEERPPLMSREQNSLTGVEGAPATAALQRAGVDVELREAPVVRQVALISRLPEPACALGLYRTPEREKLGKYSRHPIYTSPPQGLLTLAVGPIGPGTTSFARVLATPGISLVLRNGYSYGAAMDRALAGAKARILRSPDGSLGRARMVLTGLADASLFTAEEGTALIEQLGREGANLTLRLYADTPPGEGRYFFCSRSVPDALLRSLDDGLASLHGGSAGATLPR